MSGKRWVMSAAAVLAATAAFFSAPAWAVDTPAPIAPIAPIQPSFAPVAPVSPSIAPVRPVEPLGTGSPTAAPRRTTSTVTSEAFQPPSAPSGLAAVQQRISGIASSVAALMTRLGTLGQSDGEPFSAVTSAEAADILRQGRGLFSSGVTAPQIQVDAAGCPVAVPDGTLREGAAEIGVAQLCADSVAQAATPEAAQAIKWAFTQLGAPYACGGVGRLDPYRFDCSSLVARAYFEGAGLATATKTWSPTTRELMPWDGAELAKWADFVDPSAIRPGDLLLYRSCDTGQCTYQHVAMALADGYMLHTNRCGDVAHVTRSWGTGPEKNFVVARRVNPEAAR